MFININSIYDYWKYLYAYCKYIVSRFQTKLFVGLYKRIFQDDKVFTCLLWVQEQLFLCDTIERSG